MAADGLAKSLSQITEGTTIASECRSSRVDLDSQREGDEDSLSMLADLVASPLTRSVARRIRAIVDGDFLEA